MSDNSDEKMPSDEIGTLAKYGSYIYTTLVGAFVAGMQWISLKLTVSHNREIAEKDMKANKESLAKDLESSNQLINQRMETIQIDVQRLERTTDSLAKEMRQQSDTAKEMKGLLESALNKIGE